MNRREFLKLCVTAVAGNAVLVMSRVDDPKNWNYEMIDVTPSSIGRLEGWRFIVSPSIPEPARPRQKVNAFIHRKAGHYGF